MLGSRVGTMGPLYRSKTGTGGDDEGNSAPLVLLIGDSNAVGQGTTDAADTGFAVLLPFAPVNHNGTYGLAAADPPTMVNVPTQSLQPYATGGVPGLGFELTLGRSLYQEGRTTQIVKFAVNGTTADDYKPSSTYPSTGGNLLTRLYTYLDARIAELGALGGVIISLGTNDAGDVTKAGNYETNMTAIIGSLRSRYGNTLPVVIPRLNINSTQPNKVTVRTAQSNLDAASVFTVVVDNDDLLLTDGLHYFTDGYLTLGQRIAYALFGLSGKALRSISTSSPQVVGREVAARGAGALSPLSWPGAKAGDLEIMLVATGLVDGAGQATLSNAQGFNAVASGAITSQYLTLDENVKVWSRLVDQPTLDANGGRMPAPTIADTNNFNAAIIFTIRGPRANPVVDVVATSKNDDNGTSLTMTGVTTGFADELILMLVGAYSGSGTNTIAVVNTSLTDVVEFHDGVYPIGSDYQMLSLTTGLKPAAGAVGMANATTVSNAILGGVVLGVRA